MATRKRTKRLPQGSRTVGRSRSKAKAKTEPKTKPKKEEFSSEKTTVEIPEPSCRLEQLPVELIHMIRLNLPPESRITLALTSRLMFSIMGGVGERTWNNVPRRGLDQAISHANRDGLYLPPRMALLTLLERDMLLRTLCDCCQILHSPLLLDVSPKHPLPNGMSRCDTTRIHLSIEGGSITLPLIRAAVNWDRRGWDAGSLLDCLTRAHLRYRDWGVIYTTSQARVVNGRVLSKHEAVIFDRTLPLNDCATASGLVALNQSVAARFLKDDGPYYLPVEMPWWPGYDASHLADMRTTKCKARHGLDCTAQQPGCYLDKEVTPRRLQPYLRCLLTHKLPCNRCKRTNWAGSVPGWVSGNREYSIDSTCNAISLGEGKGRVLVFTAWRDFGAGESQLDPAWRSQLMSQNPVGGRSWWSAHSDESYLSRLGGQMVGEIYSAYQGVSRQSKYTPQIPQHVLNQLSGYLEGRSRLQTLGGH